MFNFAEVRGLIGRVEGLLRAEMSLEYVSRLDVTSKSDVNVLIGSQEFKDVLDSKDEVNIIDVRPPTEFGICQLSNSTSESG